MRILEFITLVYYWVVRWVISFIFLLYLYL